MSVGQAPVRETYPDGRILGVVNQGVVLQVTGASGDGRGTWVWVNYGDGDSEISGAIDSRLTSFSEDIISDSGYLTQDATKVLPRPAQQPRIKSIQPTAEAATD